MENEMNATLFFQLICRKMRHILTTFSQMTLQDIYINIYKYKYK